MSTRRLSGNLPAEWTSFVGRRQELASVRRTLSAARLVTLTGPGGVGKTRLALRAADAVRRSFADGVWLAELAGVTDRLLVPHVVSNALGIIDQTSRDDLQVLADFVAERRILLVLDNCEHLVPAVALLVTSLLPAAPGLRFLATSREPLGVIGEHIVAVPPLPVPGPGEPVTTQAASHYSGLTLFVERAVAASPGFEITADNVGVAARVCQRLDGIPLAIELAAARLRALTLAQLATQVDDRFGLLAGNRGAAPRLRNLRASVEWSFELCAKPERLVWLRASVFAGSFDPEGVQRVCGGEGLSADQVLDGVAGLVDKSVLIVEDGPVGRRYRMLETVRQYGLDRLRHPHPGDHCVMDEETLQDRHRDHYIELAERFDADWFGPRQVEWSQRMRGERTNLRAALSHCLDAAGQRRAGLRLAGALYYFWFGCGEVREGRYWLERALAADREPSRERSRALAACGQMLLIQGDATAAVVRARESVELARRLDEPFYESDALHILGTSLVYSGDPAAGLPLLEESVAVAARLGDAYPVATALAEMLLGMGRLLAGDPARAATLAADSVAVCRANGDQWLRSHALSASVTAALALGEVAQAAGYARESLQACRVLRDPLSAQSALEFLAWTAVARHDYPRASRLLGAVARQWRDIGGSPFVGPMLERHQECEAAAREALGEAAYDLEYHRGVDMILDEAIVYGLGEDRATTAGKPAAHDASGPVLTRREHQIAELVAQGLTNRQIADRLVISRRTAESHVENILSKFGFATRAQIATWYSRHGRQADPE